VTDEDKNMQPEATLPHREGPSWGLMLAIIFFAMLVAAGIAWLFIHPFLARH
jgi:hypothetical protein